MGKKFISALSAVVLIFSILVVKNEQANAAGCKLVKPMGKTIGQIQVGSLLMPVKSFTYPAGGIMEPQKSTLMAALSSRHMPLSSTMGTSVIAWHVNYAGCTNPLNILTSKSVGYTFKVKDEKGKTTTYKIDRKLIVKKGNYKESWFNLIGPRKLLLATCTGSFKDGHYTNNAIIFASPK